MRTLLEKAIVHLLNGDDEKAAALFHKFMVERARQIHESLRQDEGADDDNLDENWDSEIKEEEYFDDDELGDDSAAPAMGGGAESPIDGEMGDDAAMGGDVADDDGMGGDDVVDDGMGGDDDGLDDPAMGGDSEPGLEGKIDDLTDKIDQLTAEFDRVMSDFHDDDGDDTMGGDDDGLGLDGDVPSDDSGSDFGDDTSSEPDMGGGGSDDLAGRMEDDMTDDEQHDPIPETMAAIKTKEKGKIKGVSEDDDDGEEDIDESDDLADITESVLDELEKITPITPKEHSGVGSNSQVYKGGMTSAGNDSPIPHHNVMDRVKGEPVFTKGPTHKGYEREEAPKVDVPQKLEKNVRLGNRRKTWSDTMKTVDAKGDSSALLHKDFAKGMPAATQSVIDGKSKKG